MPQSRSGARKPVRLESRRPIREASTVCSPCTGTYTVTVEMPGFVAETVNDIIVDINAARRLTSVLRVAGVNEQLEVALPALDVSRTALGRTITPQEVRRLPVPSRDFSTLTRYRSTCSRARQNWRGGRKRRSAWQSEPRSLEGLSL